MSYKDALAGSRVTSSTGGYGWKADARSGLGLPGGHIKDIMCPYR
jgi:hypothetical protein